MDPNALLLEAVRSATTAARAAMELAATVKRGTATQLMDRPKPFETVDRESDVSRWAEWKFVFVNWLAGKDENFQLELDQIEANVHTSVEAADMAAETKERAIQLYQAFSTLLRGKYLRITKGVKNRNGYEVYRQVLLELEPNARNRALGLLSRVISAPQPSPGVDFPDHLRLIESMMEEYERIKNKPMDDDIKVASILKATPDELRENLSLKITDSTTYTQLREYILNYYTALRQWDPVPMDISQVKGGKHSKKGDGKTPFKPCRFCQKTNHSEDRCFKNPANLGSKSDPKGKKGKGGGKSKDAGKTGKGHEGDKPRCQICGKIGHTAKDCWSRDPNKPAKGPGKGRQVKGIESSSAAASDPGTSISGRVPQSVAAVSSASDWPSLSGWTMMISTSENWPISIESSEDEPHSCSPLHSQFPPVETHSSFCCFRTDLLVKSEHVEPCVSISAASSSFATPDHVSDNKSIDDVCTHMHTLASPVCSEGIPFSAESVILQSSAAHFDSALESQPSDVSSAHLSNSFPGIVSVPSHSESFDEQPCDDAHPDEHDDDSTDEKLSINDGAPPDDEIEPHSHDVDVSFGHVQQKSSDDVRSLASDDVRSHSNPVHSSDSDDSFSRELEHSLTDHSVVRAVRSNRRTLMLFDSGSDEHVCNDSFAPNTEMSYSTDVTHTMRDAQGTIIPSVGQKSVNFSLPDLDSPSAHIHAGAKFHVGSVKGPILSVGKLLRKGFTAFLSGGESYLEHNGRRTPIHLIRNSLYLDADVCSIEQQESSGESDVVDELAWYSQANADSSDIVQYDPYMSVDPVLSEEQSLGLSQSVEDSESSQGHELESHEREYPEGELAVFWRGVRLNSNSLVTHMKGRLKELSAPGWGTKSQLWKRLQERTKLDNEARAIADVLAQRESDLTNPSLPPALPLVMPGVSAPTDEERIRHELTHLPFAPWCEECQRAKGRDMPHHGILHRGETRGIPLIVMDYCDAGTDSAGNPLQKAESTCLVVVDNDTGYPCAITTPTKDMSSMSYLIAVCVKFIEFMKHDRVCIRTDGEPSIKSLALKIKQARLPKVTILEDTPLYSSASNGRAERTIQTVRRQAIALRLGVERQYGVKIDASHPLYSWLMRHSAWLLARYHVKASGRTCFNEAFDTHYSSEILPFAETVLFREPRPDHNRLSQGRRQRKGEPQFERGIWLGRSDESDEHYVGCSRGVFRARSVRRLEPAKQHDLALLASLIGSTSDMRPSGLIQKPHQRFPKPVPVMMAVHPEGEEEDEAGDDPEDPSSASPIASTVLASDGFSTPLAPVPEPSSAHSKSLARDHPGDEAPSTPKRMTRARVEEFRSPKRFPESAEGSPAPKSPRYSREDGPVFREDDPDAALRSPVTPMSTMVWPLPESLRVRAIQSQTVDEDEQIVESFGHELLRGDHLSPEEWEALQAEGRRVELQKLADFGVYEVVPVEQSYGKKRITTRWEEKLKFDQDHNLICRSRFVGREFKWADPYREDLFAPSTSSSTSRIIDVITVKRGWKTAIGDATTAFFHADEEEECYVDPPKDWLADQENQQVMWRLRKQLPGRRKAPQAWIDFIADTLVGKRSYVRCTEMPCFFRNPDTEVCLEVHMDDIHATGPDEHLYSALEDLKSDVMLKVEGPFGPGDEYTHLQRRRTRTPDGGMLIRCGEKHIPNLLRVLSLENAKEKSTPSIKEDIDQADPEPKYLSPDEASVFRSGGGIVLYIAFDRPDIQFAVKCIAQHMAKPTEFAMKMLKHLARYLKGTQQYGVYLAPGGDLSEIEVRTDSDWAGDKRSRKSTSSAHILLAGALIGSFSRTQTVIAMASGESEYYAAVSGACEGILIRSVLSFLGIDCRLKVRLDSSAARGICSRQGVGRVRHLEVKTLWLQTQVKERNLYIGSIPGLENSADLGTKSLTREVVLKHCKAINIYDGDTLLPVGSSTVSTIAHSVAVPSSSSGIARQSFILAAMTLLAQANQADATHSQFSSISSQFPTISTNSEGACLGLIQTDKTTDTDSIMLYVFVVVFVLGMFVGVWFTRVCTWMFKPAPVIADTHAVRTIGVQSQTTYRRSLSNSRFMVLPEHSQGTFI